MKVLGITDASRYGKTYIVEITESELRNAFEKGYESTDFLELKAGQEISLAGIPDQRQRITNAVNAMSTAYKEFVKAAPVMAKVARIIAGENQPLTPTEQS